MTRCVLTAALVAAVVVPVRAQVPSYMTDMPACARFREFLQSDLTLETAGRMASATSGREGDLLVAGSAGTGGVSVAAWYDALRVWRVAGGVRTEPDASGFLGGQYQGLLTADGAFTPGRRPFVPDQLREVMDMASALDDFLPRLPPRVLQVGEEWRSGDTLAIQRLADSASLTRYRVRLERHGLVPPAPGDTLVPSYTRDLTDVGVVAWRPGAGLERYDHRIEVVADIPAGGAVRRPVRSQLRQRAVLERGPADAADCGPAASPR